MHAASAVEELESNAVARVQTREEACYAAGDYRRRVLRDNVAPNPDHPAAEKPAHVPQQPPHHKPSDIRALHRVRQLVHQPRALRLSVGELSEIVQKGESTSASRTNLAPFTTN